MAGSTVRRTVSRHRLTIESILCVRWARVRIVGREGNAYCRIRVTRGGVQTYGSVVRWPRKQGWPRYDPIPILSQFQIAHETHAVTPDRA